MAVNFAKLPELSLQVSGANPSQYRPKATDDAANLSRPYLAQPDQGRGAAAGGQFRQAVATAVETIGPSRRASIRPCASHRIMN